MNESIFKDETRFTVSIRERKNGSYGWELKIRCQTLKELEQMMEESRALIKRKIGTWENEKKIQDK